MKFTDLFIRRPVLALVVNLLIIIAGLQAIRTLNVRQYPRSENATVTVTTVYVGASANLVRGFITTPLERAIAAADGIEYMESQSTLGLSTINVRLKLNYDSTKALAEISSKVDQVRRDLPPEAEVPVINIESADSQFASAYLSFSSDILQQNEITDYLVRVVQPRLSAIPGVQRADILGARTFAMRIWLKPDRMAALNISPAQVRQALAANNFLAALGRSKGAFIQVNLTADTNLQHGRGVQAPGGARAERDHRAPGRHRRRGAGGRGLRRRGPLFRADRGLHGDLAAPQRQFPRRHQAGAGGDGRPSSATCRPDLQARVAYDATNYITNAIHEVLKTLGDTLLIVMVVIFLFLGSFRSVLIPVVAIPLSLIGGVFLMQAFGFTVNLLTLLAIVLSVGLVVDDAIVVVENVERHLREGKSPAGGGPGRRPRTGRADHRHDHHPGGGLPAHRPAGGADRLALPRVRLHPGRSGHHLRDRGPDPVAGHVGQAAQARHRGARPGRPHHPRLRAPEKRLRPPARRHPGGASGGLHGLDRGVPR